MKKTPMIVVLMMSAVLLAGCGQSKEESVSGPGNGQRPNGQQEGFEPGGVAGRQPDFTAVAEKLGVSEEELKAALESQKGQPPDFAQAAEQLGISEEELQEAMGFPKDGEGRPQPNSQTPEDSQ